MLFYPRKMLSVLDLPASQSLLNIVNNIINISSKRNKHQAKAQNSVLVTSSPSMQDNHLLSSEDNPLSSIAQILFVQTSGQKEQTKLCLFSWSTGNLMSVVYQKRKGHQ